MQCPSSSHLWAFLSPLYKVQHWISYFDLQIHKVVASWNLMVACVVKQVYWVVRLGVACVACWFCTKDNGSQSFQLIRFWLPGWKCQKQNISAMSVWMAVFAMQCECCLYLCGSKWSHGPMEWERYSCSSVPVSCHAASSCMCVVAYLFVRRAAMVQRFSLVKNDTKSKHSTQKPEISFRDRTKETRFTRIGWTGCSTAALPCLLFCAVVLYLCQE